MNTFVKPLLFVAAPLFLATSAVAQTLATVGAPTADSLARLVMARFASATPEAFDSAFVDALGRDVVRSAVQQRSVRRAGLQRVIWQGPTSAVLLLAGTVAPARERPLPLDAAAGSDETNRVRRFSGFYAATKTGDSWFLGRQIPLDTLNYIRAQTVHAAITPGTGLESIDTLAIDIGGPYGFAARFNTAARISAMELDGKPVAYEFGGGLFWFDAKPKKHAQLVMRYALVESRPPATPARDSTAPAPPAGPPAFGAYHNTDGWLPFFGYDSGNSFARLTATITIPAAYRLTVSVPQTETVENGVRTVVARSMHPQFLLALAYDRDWRVASSSIATSFGPVRVETFLVPDFRFTHDSLTQVAARVYDVLGQRFGEPQAPTRYVAMVSNRAVGRGGFSVRMNNIVVGGSGATRLEEPLGPSYVLAHEIAHGWTMNASGFAANMLQEGWATFAEGTVLSAVYGKETERAFWERQRTGYMTGLDRAGFAGGFEGRQSILGNPDNGRIHYFKGSWVFRSLEHALGSATFDKGIRDYIAIRNEAKAAGHEEFIASMSRAAGRDMGAFIRPWLDGKYIPNVEARLEGTRVIVSQVQPDVVFDLLLDIALTTSPGTAVQRRVHLRRRADTLNVADVGPVTDVHVDPDHYYLLQRHAGELVRFELPASAAPNAKVVELTGNFLGKPMPATLVGDAWVLELPLSEGRYIWQWRVDGSTPNEEVTVAAAAGTADTNARVGVRWVKPLQRLSEAYPR